MKNKLADLNDHLFAAIERLNDEDLDPEKVEHEAKRADAIVALSEQVLRNADIQLKAVKIIADHGDRFTPMLPAIGQSRE